jgi:hypothetical protein
MAVTTPLYPGLTDLAALTHNGDVVRMVDEWVRSTTIFKDMPFVPSTDALQDVSGYIDGDLPKGSWTDLDTGTKGTNGHFKQKVEDMGMYEDWSVYNQKHNIIMGAEYNRLRWELDQQHIISAGFEIEKVLLYGNPGKDPNQFLGIMPRLSMLTDMYGYPLLAANKTKVQEATGISKTPYICIDGFYSTTDGDTAASHDGELASILFVAKGPMAATMIYPKNQVQFGLAYNHYDFENTTDAGGNNLRVAKSQFLWAGGLRVQNRRTLVRIANIYPEDLATPSGFKALNTVLLKAFMSIPEQYRKSVSIYAPVNVIVAYNAGQQGSYSPINYGAAGLQNPDGNIRMGNFAVTPCDSMVDTESSLS